MGNFTNKMDEITPQSDLNFYSILYGDNAYKGDIVRGVLAPPASAGTTRRVLSLAKLLKLAPNLNKHFVKVSSKGEGFEQMEEKSECESSNWQTFFNVNKDTKFLIVP